jgi:hypothetical protein
MGCKTTEPGKAYIESVSIDTEKISDSMPDKLTGIFIMHPIRPTVLLQESAQKLCKIWIIRAYGTEAYKMIALEDCRKIGMLLWKMLILV